MYKSKNEIYKDYQIAIKLEIESKGSKWLKKNHYEELYERLSENQSIKLTKIEKSIENFNSQYPLSTGLFIEIPQKSEQGESIGVRHLILEHESGIELFLMLSSAGIMSTVMTKLIEKFGEELVDELISRSIEKLLKSIKNEWNKTMPYKAVFIEIRTENKGVMREHFEHFEISQLECLIHKFSQISHLSEVNQECFQGNLFDPEIKTFLDGTKTILQAND